LHGGLGFGGGLGGITAERGQLLVTEFDGQFVPFELFFDAVGLGLGHHAPVVDGAGGARRDAVHAEVAEIGLDHVVARVVGDGADRANRFAGVAANADFGVDDVLLEKGRFGGHGCLCSFCRVLAVSVVYGRRIGSG